MEPKDKIIDFFKENFLVELAEDFSEEESFLDNGVIDSTGVLELVTFLEDEFKIKVGDEEIVPENLDSLKNLVTYVQTKMSA